MPAIKPTKNAISSAKEFKTLCISVSKTYKIRVSHEAIRHLRLTMNTTVASSSLLPETIDVVFASLAERKERSFGLDDVRKWLLTPAPDEDSSSADDPLDAPSDDDPQHYVRKLLQWKCEKRKAYYLVDWEPTWEPRKHLPPTVVAAFEKERYLLVRKAFIEDEAVEDNTLNKTEA